MICSRSVEPLLEGAFVTLMHFHLMLCSCVCAELQAQLCSCLSMTSQLVCLFKRGEGKTWHLKHGGKNIRQIVLRTSMLCVDP